MADVDTKETKVVASPEKKVVEEEKSDKKEVVEEVDEDSRASENGDAKESKENGSTEEKESDEKEVESTENGDSTDAPAEVCCIKRKSTVGIEESTDIPDGVLPEKKAKVDDKAPVVEAESNGDTETAA